VYPVALGARGSLGLRTARPAAEQLADARLAARPPQGRAEHLVHRFPPGAPGHGPSYAGGGHGPSCAAGGHGPSYAAGHGPTYANGGLGPFYAGPGRTDLLAMLYLVAAGAAPSAGARAWAAETGQETAVDAVCGELDRAARRLLDGDWTILWDRIDAALTATPDPGLRDAFRGFGDEAGAPWTGVRQILDALLVVADDGHAPGTRVRTPAQVGGSIIGAWWAADGPPIGYDVWFDGTAGPRRMRPDDVVVLAGQETGYPT
jgi:hypothetical protein